MHAEIAIAAAQAGKAIVCEKPLALTVAQAEQMVQAVEAAGVANLVSFNYRRVPAVTMAKQLIDEGRLGKIFHYRGKFLQDWTISADVPQGGMATWRLDVKAAGSGVTGDLLAHCIDTAMWHNGAITRVNAMTETFIKERRHAETGKLEPVGIDDACTFFCSFDNGSMGNFESTRYARGHKALFTFEINGEHGSIGWNLHDLHRLAWFDHNDEGNRSTCRSIAARRRLHHSPTPCRAANAEQLGRSVRPHRHQPVSAEPRRLERGPKRRRVSGCVIRSYEYFWTQSDRCFWYGRTKTKMVTPLDQR